MQTPWLGRWVRLILVAACLFPVPAQAVTIAVLGAAHIHIDNFVRVLRAAPDVRVAAVWDADAERAVWAAELLHAPVAESPAMALHAGDVTAALIASETYRHPALVRAACTAGVDLFVEKPLASDPNAAWALAKCIQGRCFIPVTFCAPPPSCSSCARPSPRARLGPSPAPRW